MTALSNIPLETLEPLANQELIEQSVENEPLDEVAPIENTIDIEPEQMEGLEEIIDQNRAP